MPVDTPSFPMVLAFAVPFFVLSIALEWWGVRKGKLAGSYAAKDALTSMLMGFGNLVSDLTMGFVSLAVLMWAWQFRLFDWGLSLPVICLALGVHPLLLGFVGALNLLYQYWIHTEAIDRLPRWFEAVFNTPSHHRAHHGTDPQYLDSNYAGILIIWDKLFGTFVPEDLEIKPNYGLVQNVGTYNPIKIAFAEMWGALLAVSVRSINPFRVAL